MHRASSQKVHEGPYGGEHLYASCWNQALLYDEIDGVVHPLVDIIDGRISHCQGRGSCSLLLEVEKCIDVDVTL